MKLSDFNYLLPKELIAQYPSQEREHSRLLIVEKAKKKITHRYFTDIVRYLSCGDCLVLNNTKVIYARMVGKRDKTNPKTGGGKQEIFFLENVSQNVFRVLAKPAKKLTVGMKVLFGEGEFFARVISDQGMTKTIEFNSNGNIQDIWHRLGQIPLPPYIKRNPEDLDKERYQTVYAQAEGATAAPTAGLHFTEELLSTIREKGVNIAYITLHVNYGTFSPVKCEDIREHKMHKEYFILPKETEAVIGATRSGGNKVFAVGTTSVRVLETCAGKDGKGMIREGKGWTDLFIYPGYSFKTVDCLLTNFHFPKSTLLMLVSAFAGKELIFKAYQEAVKEKYRFFSYGDAMLII